MDWITLYLALLLAGFVLIGTEIFIPGGILGVFGTLTWLGAAIVGWQKFPYPWNIVSTISLVVISILTFVVWIRYFPKSRFGKSLALEESTASYKSHKTTEVPVGTEGKALSTLRPSGIAEFNGKRFDVVADGEWIESGEAVKISKTSGGFISVVKA
jgi:membrane-bound serine protease (ClpP class)